MDADELCRRAASFGSVAREYEAHRPSYPLEAVTWLTGPEPTRVLELGSGTGKLTRALLEVGHDVVASEPSIDMLTELTRTARSARPLAARAEQIPLRTGVVDVVVAAQAFHWFDAEQALPEIARVLRPDGVLGLLWNIPDFKVPWVRKVLGLIQLTEEAFVEPLADTDAFAVVDTKVFRHWQRFDRAALLGYISSNSYAAVRTPAERTALLEEVGAIYDGYRPGPDGMQLPWNATCYRARALSNPAQPTAGDADDGLLIEFG